MMTTFWRYKELPIWDNSWYMSGWFAKIALTENENSDAMILVGVASSIVRQILEHKGYRVFELHLYRYIYIIYRYYEQTLLYLFLVVKLVPPPHSYKTWTFFSYSCCHLYLLLGFHLYPHPIFSSRNRRRWPGGLYTHDMGLGDDA